jgi:hypothetical protein
VYLGVIGQVSDQSFNFNSIGGWNANFTTPINMKTNLSMVIKKPVTSSVDFEVDFAQIFVNVENLQGSAPGESEVHEHFLKGVGPNFGIRIVHPLFKVVVTSD